MSANDINIL